MKANKFFLLSAALCFAGIAITFWYTYRQITSDVRHNFYYRAIWEIMDFVDYGRTETKQFYADLQEKRYRNVNLGASYLALEASKSPIYTPLIDVKNNQELKNYFDRHYIANRNFSLYIKPHHWLNIQVKPNYNYFLASIGGHILIVLVLLLLIGAAAAIIYRLYLTLQQNYLLANELGIKPTQNIYKSILNGSQAIFVMFQKRINDLVNTRTQLISSISHDLKTPLTRMNYRLHLLDHESTARKCIRDTEEMRQMINELIELAHLEPQKNTRIDFGALLDVLIENYLEQGFNIQYISDETRIILRGSESLYTRIVYNLVGNALKFSSHIKVSLRCRDNNIKFSVEDDGPGVPENENLNNLFRRRYQADNQDRSRVKMSSGLGLAIVYELVHQTGGGIELKNLQPQGFGVFIHWAVMLENQQ